ncbi:MAG: glycosyltransferase [Litorilinea sp.]
MQILFLTPQLPYPPRQGATLRNYHLIRALAAQHTVDLLTLLAPGETLHAASPLHSLCRHVAAVAQPRRTAARRAWETVRSPLPDMAHRLDTPALHTLLQTWMQNTDYDIIQFEGIELAPYLATARTVSTATSTATATATATAHAPALVFDNHNCEYLLQKRNALNDLRTPQRMIGGIYSLVQWWKLRRYERWACQSATATLAVSQPDADALTALAGPDCPVHVIPNGIAAPTVPPTPSASPASAATAADAPITLVFTGKMDYRPNVDAVLWFAHEVLPRITRAYPQTVFQIVGMNPHPRILPLGEQRNIEITGMVEEIQPYIQEATVFVIPLRVGGGTRFKVLEALAAARPVVSTTLGVEGIAVIHGEHLRLADTPSAFAQAVLDLIADQRDDGGAQARKMGANAQRFVTTHYTWDSIVPRLNALYQTLQPEAQQPDLRHRDKSKQSGQSMPKDQP